MCNLDYKQILPIGMSSDEGNGGGTLILSLPITLS
jgi:hypothetical protein